MNGIRIGVVGLGRRGAGMFELAAGFDGVVPAAACDCDPERWEALAGLRGRHPGMVFYRDYETMLAEARLDAVLVETPADNHAHFCVMAMRRGVAVFSDIPSVASVEEGEALWRAQRESGAMFMTGANPNFWGFVETMCDLRRRGLLGKAEYLEAEYIHDIRNLWEATPWRKYYTAIKYCTHSLGPLLRVADGELRRVSCFGTGGGICDDPKQSDVMTATFGTDTGTVVRVTVSFINNAGFEGHSYRVFGTGGYFEHYQGRGAIPSHTVFATKELYGMGRPSKLEVDTMRPEYRHLLPGEGGHGGADYAMFDAFFRALREGGEAPVTLREGLAMTLPGIFAAESARRGGELVEISYPWD